MTSEAHSIQGERNDKRMSREKGKFGGLEGSTLSIAPDYTLEI